MLEIPAVAVIMSTYNGEKYLAEQIDSILAQEGVHVELFVRDDGSTDGTRNILTDYAANHENIHLDFGENLGWEKSFVLELKAASEFEYYSFSDQDDYWDKNKLITAVEAISRKEQQIGKNLPILYYCNLKVSDSNLNFVRKTELEKRILSLESIITRRSVSGCVMVMNFALRQLIKSRPLDDDIFLRGHDTISVTLAYAFGGALICDSEAHMCYRQHRNNAAGSPIGLFARIKKEWKEMLRYRGSEAIMAQAVLNAWDKGLDPEAKKILTLVAGYREHILSRLKIVFSPKFRTGDWRLTIVGKLKALFGLL